ncbi:MAG TPA: dipeptidase PepE [Streptosporangiaceae bacterium]|jgi:dipeptidase E
MTEALLLSNARAPGLGYLDHVRDTISEVLRGRDRLLFIPFASANADLHTETMRDSLARIGVRVDGAHLARDLCQAIAAAEAVFVGGGNSFRLLKRMREAGALKPLRERALDGMPYFGASAGSNLACASIRTTNDMPIVSPGSFEALGLIPFQVNPHYPYTATPPEMHAGESRDQRISEFLDENDVPVLGLPEGTWLRVSGTTASTGGVAHTRLFRRGAEPQELPPGSDVSTLMGLPVGFDTNRQALS